MANSESLNSLLDNRRSRFSALGCGWLLDTSIDPECLNDLERWATEKDSTAVYFCKQIEKELTDLNGPEDHEVLGRTIDVYAEALVYWRFRLRGVSICRVPAEAGVKTPDFELSIKDRSYFVEVKTPGIVAADPDLPRGTIAQDQMVYDALDSKIALEDKAKVRGVQWCELEIDPFQPSLNAPSEGDQATRRRLTRSQYLDIFTEKVSGMIKPKQLERGDSLLLIVPLRISLDFGSSVSLAPVYFDEEGPACLSGDAWHVACGKIGDQIYCMPRFEGASNLAGRLEKDGLFHRFNGLKAVGFLDKSLENRYIQSIIYRDDTFGSIVHCLADQFNDVDNSFGYTHCVLKP